MSELQTVKVPDIGDVNDVEVIEVLVAVGDTVALEDSLVTVESDKASMEIPAPVAGVITSMLVKSGDRIAEGSDILVIDVAETRKAEQTPVPPSESTQSSDASEQASTASTATAQLTDPNAEHYDLVVIGAGPGGYTSAFRAADLGLKVLLIERYPDLGGVCLNVGCIPSKALLHTAAIIQETRDMAAHGVTFGEPQIDIDKLRGFKEDVIGKLTGGLAGLAKQRNVTVAHGLASFSSTHSLLIAASDGADSSTRTVAFTSAVIAAGSKSIRIPGFPYDDPRLMDSTGALELADIPKRLLVIGGGIIGLEMGCVYAGLGTQVTVVELSAGLMPGCDRDLVRPLEKRLRADFENIFLGSKVTGMTATDAGLSVNFEGGKSPTTDTFDRVLLAVGRSPNGRELAADVAGVHVDERGFIPVNSQQQTNVLHIFAIGDIVGQPMLAHKATHEAKVAAEVAHGEKVYFDALVIPNVAYTDPEVAWVGLTELEAKEKDIAYEVGKFPWAASGRAIGNDRTEGLTKLLFDPETDRILGAGIVGTNAGELISELCLAIEMGCEAADIGLTIHPHPTLAESVAMSAEAFEGTITDLYLPKKN